VAERGSASLLVLGAGLALLSLALGLCVVAGAVAARRQAEAAADFAALGAAGRIGVGDDACAVAARIASANGARLADCAVRLSPDGRSGAVDVTVVRAFAAPGFAATDISASARAARLPA
jgi:secretion/DNA translocation related TadE-like protein